MRTANARRFRSVVFLIALLLSIQLLSRYAAADSPSRRSESGRPAFTQYESGSLLVYYYQRMIDQAIVEGEYIVYQVDKVTGEFVAVRTHWREGLPDHLPPGLITQAQAEAMFPGDVLRSALYIISPESDVFPLDPAPQNPCWVVRHVNRGMLMVTVVDAVDGRVLGNGIPPPYTGFSLSGPWTFGPCQGTWTDWRENARSWFETMGYPTESVQWPTESKVRSHVQSGQTAMFYELAHGNSQMFEGGCINGQSGEVTYAAEIEAWIADYAKMPFAFIGSCGGLCLKVDNTFAYEFRKGSTDSTTVLGYCDMSEPECDICWGQSLAWQTALFDYMSQGWTVKAAFDQANADYPQCGDNKCMRFSGDQDFAVVPVVRRDPWAPQVSVVQPNGGEVIEGGTLSEIRWVATDNAAIDSVAILLSVDGGLSFPDTIATGQPNDSSYMWTVPDIDSKTSRVKVVATDSGMNEGEDTSDNDFTLWGSISGSESAACAGACGEAVLKIAGGNPNSPVIRMVFGIPAPARVTLRIYDVAGRRVADLVSGPVSDGYHSVLWHGRSSAGTRVGPGVYFVRLDAGNTSRTAKLVIAR